MNVCISVLVGNDEERCPLRPEEGIESLGERVTGSSELFHIEPRDQP